MKRIEFTPYFSAAVALILLFIWAAIASVHYIAPAVADVAAEILGLFL